MTHDNAALERLRSAGFTLEALSDDQLSVLTDLSPHELHLLEDIKRRLDEAEPEVRAHGDIAGGALF